MNLIRIVFCKMYWTLTGVYFLFFWGVGGGSEFVFSPSSVWYKGFKVKNLCGKV